MCIAMYYGGRRGDVRQTGTLARKSALRMLTAVSEAEVRVYLAKADLPTAQGSRAWLRPQRTDVHPHFPACHGLPTLAPPSEDRCASTFPSMPWWKSFLESTSLLSPTTARLLATQEAEGNGSRGGKPEVSTEDK